MNTAANPPMNSRIGTTGRALALGLGPPATNDR